MVKIGFPLDNVLCNLLIKGFSGTRNVVSYNTMIGVLFYNGKMDKAISIWEELEEDNTCFPDSVTYAVVIRGLCENGLTSKALGIMKDAQIDGWAKLDVFAYSSIIKGLCKDGRLKEALFLFEQMEKNVWLLPKPFNL
jgi:pentatricopeptide repeat protein